MPAFFAREAFASLMALKPHQGCKSIILGRPAEVLLVDCPQAAIDIDTPEDYASAMML